MSAAGRPAHGPNILHNQGSSLRDIIQQTLIIGPEILVHVVGADSGDDRRIAAEIAESQILCRQDLRLDSQSLQGNGNLVPRAGNVSNGQVRSYLNFESLDSGFSAADRSSWSNFPDRKSHHIRGGIPDCPSWQRLRSDSCPVWLRRV